MVTRWKDLENTDIENCIKKILDYKGENHKNVEKFKSSKMFEKNQEFIFNSTKIIFNRIDFRLESYVEHTGDINETEGFIIIYYNGRDINYIINKPIGDLRKILGCMRQKNKITHNMLPLDNNFLIWLISKVYNENNNLNEETEIKIIKGFYGDTSDSLSKITANGESIMNIISALSFLLESDNLKHLHISFKYKEHNNIELKLWNTSNKAIDTDIKVYLGNIESNPYECYTKLLLIILIDLLPKVWGFYQEEIENEDWGNSQYGEFLEKISNDISDRIEEKKNEMKNQIKNNIELKTS